MLCDVSAEQQQQCIDMLVAETSCSPEAAATLIEPDYAERVKLFASYTLSQTGTQIRECHARIDALKKNSKECLGMICFAIPLITASMFRLVMTNDWSLIFAISR